MGVIFFFFHFHHHCCPIHWTFSIGISGQTQWWLYFKFQKVLVSNYTMVVNGDRFWIGPVLTANWQSYVVYGWGLLTPIYKKDKKYCWKMFNFFPFTLNVPIKKHPNRSDPVKTLLCRVLESNNDFHIKRFFGYRLFNTLTHFRR